MQHHQKPSAFLVASTKAAHEWSANRCIAHVSSDWLDELLSDAQFSSISSMAKIRLLLAGLLALDQQQAQAVGMAGSSSSSSHRAASELQQGLQRLRDAVAADADQWAKVMAAAAGSMDGRLDLQAVMRQSPAVQESMTSLMQQVAASNNQHLMPPLEDDFLRDPPSLLDPAAGHFVVRQNPRVQPLSEGFSYTQATPPPPSLLRATGLQPGTTGGAQVAAGHRQPRTQQAGAAGGLARAKSGHLERQHTVQLLDEEEQANLFKNTHQKHGVAGAVRHEQVAYEKPDRQQQQQQRPRQPPQPSRQEEAPKGRRFNIYGAAAARPSPEALAAARAAAGGGGGGGGRGRSSGAPRQQQQQQPRQPPQPLRDADIDDLFDDDGFIDDREIQQPAPTGVSITGRHFLQRKCASGDGGGDAGQQQGEAADGERDATPDELMDDLEEAADEPAAAEAAAAGGDGGGEQQQDEGGAAVEGASQAAARGAAAQPPSSAGGAAKRRRMHIIASDSEDDD